MLTLGQARALAATLLSRRGEVAIAAAVLNAQLACRAGDPDREDDWRLVARLMDGMRAGDLAPNLHHEAAPLLRRESGPGGRMGSWSTCRRGRSVPYWPTACTSPWQAPFPPPSSRG
jgi:hypothetical protein